MAVDPTLLDGYPRLNGPVEVPVDMLGGMLRAERHHHISRALTERGVVRVRELVSQFRVTSETIRRDLEELEQQGQLVRTHGGAVLASPKEEPFDVRRQANVPEKIAIARRALDEIGEADVIGLDDSTTSLHLARLLPDEPRTVVTNSLSVVSELVSKPSITTIVTGGILDRETLGMHGSAAIQCVSKFSISVAFLSCFGYDRARGAGQAVERHAEFKQAMMRVSDRIVLLIDHTKIGRKPAFFFCTPEQADRIISDE